MCKQRRTIGIRMPADETCQALLAMLDRPLLCTSVRRPASAQGGDPSSCWLEEPARMRDEFAPRGASFVVDSGTRLAEPSTVIDLSSEEAVLLRQGKGDAAVWGL